jgi:hypothetical protein
MGATYDLAKENLSMVGSPTEATDYLFDLANQFGASMALLEPQVKKAYKKTLQAVEAFTSNSFFTRAWILQELALAPTIFLCCGTRICPFDHIGRVIARIHAPSNPLQMLSWTWTSIKRVHQGRSETGRAASLSSSPIRAGQGLFEPSLGKLEIFIPSTNVLGGEIPRLQDFVPGEARAAFRNLDTLDVLHKGANFSGCKDPRDLLYARRGLAKDNTIPYPDYSTDSERCTSSLRGIAS